MQNLYKDLEKILLSNDNFKSEDGKVLKNKVTESAVSNDKELITALLKNAKLKKHFFDEIEKGIVAFDREKFIRFINTKEFLPNSFTSFTNKIGLHDGKEYLNSSDKVSLVWAYKDCVLEGGQDKEDQRRSEIFYNETLAPDEIDRLFEKKVLTNFKKHSKKGEEVPKEITDSDNLIIKGNNLLALHSLRKKYAGKVKLIYIDIPYNTGSDGFNYNDKFNHSTWLTFMKNRLAVAKDLLSNDGVIFVQCDDNEQAYLKVLMDEVFLRENYLNTISVKTKASSGASGGGEDKRIKKNTEYILVYQASESFEGFNDIYSDKPLKDYIDERKEASKNFAYKTVFVSDIKKTFVKTIKSGRGDDIKIYRINNPKFSSISKIAKEEKCEQSEVYDKYFDKIFTLENAQTSIRGRVLDAVGVDDDYYVAEYAPVSGKNKGTVTEVIFGGRTKRLLSWLKNVAHRDDKGDLIKRDRVGTLWDDLSWSSVSMEGGVTLANGKKPEALIERIIEMSTQENDIVVDYHLGSGTTCAVAHKMNRRYVGIEQLDYGDDDSAVRIKNVINGDKTGVSSSANWKGGGSFVYAELKKWNQEYVDGIEKADTAKKLLALYEKMKKEAFFRYEIDLSKFDVKEFSRLELVDQKRVLLDCLDKNHLYVNYSDINDATYKVSPEDKKLNKLFYGE